MKSPQSVKVREGSMKSSVKGLEVCVRFDVFQSKDVLLHILLIVIIGRVLLLKEPASRWGLEEGGSIESVMQYVNNMFRAGLRG